MAHWIFQSNPERFDLIADWQDNKKVTWSANQHRGSLSPGDSIYFRVTGKSAGLYGLGEVLSSCYESDSDEFGSWKVDVRYKSLIDPPLLRPETDRVPQLKSFSALSGFMGTIRPVPPDIAQEIDQLIASSRSVRTPIAIGTEFATREDVARAGLHSPHRAGIHPQFEGARAESIVVSGGYRDDEDLGDVIIYTGQGGQKNGVQVQDQAIEKGNKALVRAQLEGTPVRVIRGHRGDSRFSPSSGYRYDGLYQVRNHWFKNSIDGPRVVQFELVAVDYGTQSTAITPAGTIAPPSGNASPDRRARSSNSIIRDQRNVDWIKTHYENTCQVCRIQLMTDAGPISVGAHIQGLGRPFNGPDVVQNMLCLCHNCHAIFDAGAFYLDDDCSTIRWIHSPIGQRLTNNAVELLRKDGHEIGLEFVKHHKHLIAGVLE